MFRARKEYEEACRLLDRCGEGLAAHHAALEAAELAAAEAGAAGTAAQQRTREAEQAAAETETALQTLQARGREMEARQAELESSHAEKMEALRRTLADEAASAQANVRGGRGGCVLNQGRNG